MPVTDDDEGLSDDDGFYFPIDYLLRTWDAYRNHGVLPDAGGINDQNPKWWVDINRLARRFALIKRDLKEAQDAQEALQGLTGHAGDGQNWKDWMNG